ncbi:Odorant-binding protein 50a [Drosophila willistoni]|nr:Odorant-binding protein 50a [Drosophila willistoni]
MAAKCPTAPKSLQNVQICCPAPMPNWGVYNGECGSSGTQPSLQCRLACIFNATSALPANHNQLNLSQVRPMLERAFGMPLLIDAYVKNFGTCSNLVHSKYDQLTKLSHQIDACDRHALFYSLCAYSRLMMNCPTNLWQKANKKCQEARNYMKTCSWPALKMFMKST